MNSKELAELDLGSLLQFDLLKKVIEHFLKEQKSLVHKVNSIEDKMRKENSKIIQAVTAIQNQVNKASAVQPQTIIIKEDKQSQDISNNNNNNNDATNKDTRDNNNTLLSPRTPIDSIKPIIEDPLLSETGMIKDTISPKKDTHPSYLIDQNPLIEELNQKVADLTDIVEELKAKMNEFNLYDVFKTTIEGSDVQGQPGQGTNKGKGEIDLVLMKALESKVFLKLNQLEDKQKSTDQSIVKIKVDLSNSTNKSDSAYRTAFQQREALETYIKHNDKALEDLDTKISTFVTNTNEDINNQIQLLKADLAKAMEDSNASIKKTSSLKPLKPKDSFNTLVPSVPQEVLNEMQNELKLMINKSISDSEKYIKGVISELAVDSIRKDVLQIQKALSIKLEKKDLQDIFFKIDGFNSVIQGMKDEMENINSTHRNNIQSIDKLSKRAEFLTNLIYTKQPVNSNDSSSGALSQNIKLPPIDFTKYVTQSQLTQVQSALQTDCDKMELRLDELKRLMEVNDEQHKFFACEKDIRNMEQCLMNELDEYKLNAMKKFSDKAETLKSFRFIDLQIKHLIGMSNTNGGNSKDKEGSHNENWLIAKRPVGMYQCASCDSNLVDLTAKNEFIPWNRIQSREDAKKYRMGHGFSKMLQMVNTDLLKSAEIAKEPHSDGEEGNNVINSKGDIEKDKDKHNQNNISVASITNLPKILQSNCLDMSQDTNEHIDDNVIDDPHGPKVVKIYKKLKKDETHSLKIKGSPVQRDKR